MKTLNEPKAVIVTASGEIMHLERSPLKESMLRLTLPPGTLASVINGKSSPFPDDSRQIGGHTLCHLSVTSLSSSMSFYT